MWRLSRMYQCMHRGGGYSSQILVGMCRGKVKNGQGLRFERENAGLRNELEPFWAWKCESPERPLTRGAAERFAFGLSRLWEAMNGLKIRNFENYGLRNGKISKKNVKRWCSGTDFLVICENDMLRNGNSGLKMGVSRAAHTQYACIWKYPPPCINR